MGEDLVGLDGHIPTAGLGAEPHPVVAGRPTHQHHLLGGEAVEDPVADEVAVGAAADEVAGATDTEGLEAVHGQAGQEPLGVWAAQVGRRHVKRLVVERDPLAPRPLLVTPRRELRSDELGRLAQHGVLEDRSLAVAVQVVDEVGNGVQEILERSGRVIWAVTSSPLGVNLCAGAAAPAMGGHPPDHGVDVRPGPAADPWVEAYNSASATWEATSRRTSHVGLELDDDGQTLSIPNGRAEHVEGETLTSGGGYSTAFERDTVVRVPSLATEDRGGCTWARSADDARDDIDHGGDDDDAEHVRGRGVSQQEPPKAGRQQLCVRHLVRHPNREGEIGEVR